MQLKAVDKHEMGFKCYTSLMHLVGVRAIGRLVLLQDSVLP
jgi:hypothetical protein